MTIIKNFSYILKKESSCKSLPESYFFYLIISPRSCLQIHISCNVTISYIKYFLRAAIILNLRNKQRRTSRLPTENNICTFLSYFFPPCRPYISHFSRFQEITGQKAQLNSVRSLPGRPFRKRQDDQIQI